MRLMGLQAEARPMSQTRDRRPAPPGMQRGVSRLRGRLPTPTPGSRIVNPENLDFLS